MKKLFKRIAPLLLALVMVMGSCLTVSAAVPSSTDEYKSLVSKYAHEGYPYAICVKDSQSPSQAFLIYYFSSEPFFKDGYVYFNTKWSYFTHIYNSSNDSWHMSQSVEHGTSNMCNLTLSPGRSIVYTSADLYLVGADKEKDEPFFRGPERPLVAAVRGVSPEEALKEVILLIPLSILFLAGCLGLRKGLRLLLTLLRRA